MQKLIRKFFRWIFREELEKIEKQEIGYRQKQIEIDGRMKKLDKLFENLDITLDQNVYSPSWAVISIQGEKSDFIRFYDLGKEELRHIEQFLRYFEKEGINRNKIDMVPQAKSWLECYRGNEKRNKYF